MRKLLAAMACAGLVLAAGLTTTSAQTGTPKTGKKPAAKAKYITTKSGLKYLDIKVGKGPMPKLGELVSVNYTGTFTDGRVFDASSKHIDAQHPHGAPYQYPLGGEVIAAWNEALATMRVGGKRKIICPPNLAYGESGRQGIPPNTTLLFDIELVKIGP